MAGDTLGLNPADRLGAATMRDGGLAMDAQGLNALRRTAGRSPHEALRHASRQFEALFMQMMLKSMREATPGESLLGGSTEKFYTGMLDQQLGQSLSGRGLGLAQALERQMLRQLAAPEDTAAAGQPPGRFVTGMEGRPFGAPLPPRGLAHEEKMAPLPLAGAQSFARFMPGKPGPADLKAYEQQTLAAASLSRSALAPDHVERFMAQHLPAARRASEASGLPAQLILAQAALESGWGRREPRGEGGEPSFNLFGIKADRSWKGPSVQTLTTEVVDGQPRSVRARFRAYGSYEEAFADHARFLSTQPRYAPVREAPDAHRAAEGLQRAGYATDPHYAAKLQRVMQRLS